MTKDRVSAPAGRLARWLARARVQVCPGLRQVGALRAASWQTVGGERLAHNLTLREQQFGERPGAQPFDGPPGALDGGQGGTAAGPHGRAAIDVQNHFTDVPRGTTQGRALLGPQPGVPLKQHLHGDGAVCTQARCQGAGRVQPGAQPAASGRSAS